MKYASLSRRIVSSVVDSHIVGFAVYLLWLVSGTWIRFYAHSAGSMVWTKLAIIAAYCVSYLTYATFFIFKTGITPGQAIAGARVLRVDESTCVPLKTAFLRAALFLAYFIPFVGALAVFASASAIVSDDRHQAWHDRVCGTIVAERGGAER